MRAMNRNPGTVKEAADRRSLRQKANKARGFADPSMERGYPQGEGVSGAASSGTPLPPEPAQPQGVKGKGKGKEVSFFTERERFSQKQVFFLSAQPFPGKMVFSRKGDFLWLAPKLMRY